ncbi:DegT/DnrJ/EryC1/StrS aminotransferase family protein [Synechococcus sp. CS-1327]|uniref:DegT/DnrJ/EryC1/StrS family aminotransferase n=1 Tax=Synechococcus sp. CS-1327 TaxID=2847977 RepID=UPI00223C525A|nr:DegT/DnrJ/EryC1/StrS family aminotransferase [Synechococcus sp. CS-1327]MCT0234529.1 DegT/DnrJ/EryC1/StrS family aminotransferase [Synechococcus sp. CS-1327]
MTSPPEPIYVTRPHLPPLADVVKLLEGVWDCRILTNDGPLHQQLEDELALFLGVEHLSLFTNGTLALVVALKALRLQGEVITSPFSFIATSEALSWNGLEPMFADIDTRSFGLDPASIEACITPRTSAILAVHCYGFPCDVEAIQRLADDYSLRVIYDAAHAFAVDCHCGSLLQHGNLSILSFHATKVFTTFEGGAIISPDAKTKKRIDRLKNFGFVDDSTVAVNGINAKMSELHAAVGLAQLPGIRAAIELRRAVAEAYLRHLAGLEHLQLPDFSQAARPNYAYFPVLIADGAPINSDDLAEHLRNHGIIPRRYFHPLIPDFQCFRSNASADPARYPEAVRAARQVLCLPIYPDLALAQVERIAGLIRQRFGGIGIAADTTCS